MPSCFFVSDLHGQLHRFNQLFRAIRGERPAAVFVGGDILPHGFGLGGSAAFACDNFVAEYLAVQLRDLRDFLKHDYPAVFLILGNDDPRMWERDVIALEDAGLVHYVHAKGTDFGDYRVYGYAYVPPSPFLLKDWERYDVSRGVDPGCVSPEEGRRTVEVAANETRYATIKDDLERLTAAQPLDRAIMLFHAPPYNSALDRAALDGLQIDHVPLDVHVGSIAVQRFIAARQPLITLHGHVHESTRLTGAWRERFGLTWAFNAAHDGPELCLVRFDPAHPDEARRELL